MKKNLIALFGVLLAVFTIFGGKTVNAESLGGFSIEAVLPDNHINENDYFDLLMQPGQRQTITANVENYSDKETTYEISVNPAFTSDGGAIDYSTRDGKLDKSIPFDIRKVVIPEQTELTVPANSSKKINLNIAMPNMSFKGRVLGGLRIEKKTKDNVAKQKSTGKPKAAISTKLAYSLAIVLQTSKDKVEPALKYLKTEPASVDTYALIQMSFQNPSATIIPKLIFTTTVKKDGKKYIENTSKAYQVAPNTNFHVDLPIDGQRVEAGDYSVKVVARSGPFYKWEFSDKFTVKQEKADIVNKNSVFPTKEKKFNIWIIITIVLAVILVGFIAYLLWKRKKDQKKDSQINS